MIYSDLPSPGAITQSEALRKATAKALSYVQVQCGLRNVIPDQLVTLRAFFQAAVKYLDDLEEAGPAGPRELVLPPQEPVDPADLDGETTKA